MPTYVYHCPDCEHEFELFQRFADKPKKSCPSCKKRKLYKVPQLSHAFIKLADSEIKTVGHLAHRNSERMGSDRVAELTEKDPNQQRKKRLKENAPWWRPGTIGPSKKVKKLITEKDKQKYIEGK